MFRNQKNRIANVYKNIYNREYPLDERLGALFTLSGSLAALAGGIASIVAQTRPIAYILCFCLFAFAPVIGALPAHGKTISFSAMWNKHTIFLMMTVGVPVIWINGGGVHGGVTFFFIFEMFYLGIASSGKEYYVWAAIMTATHIACFAMYIVAPEMIYELPNESCVFTSICSCLFIVLGSIIYTVSMQKKIYLQEFNYANSLIEELKDVNIAEKKFLTNIAHEIRTPLNGILGLNDMIRESKSIGQIYYYSKNIETAGNMLKNLLNDILDFQKIDSGQLQLVEEDVSIQEMMDELYSIVFPTILKKDLIYKTDIQDSIHKIKCDKVRLMQILLNLINNAIKYTDKGKVVITISECEIDDKWNEYIFKIADTGKGIKPEALGKLFSIYDKAEENVVNGIESSGVGLALVKKLVALMGGEITVDSTYGIGSTFTVIIPFEKGSNNCETDEGIDEEEGKTAYRGTALVVDDNSINRIVVKSMLDKIGFDATSASSGCGAIELCKQRNFKVIFMDFQMPEMNGAEALAEIKNLDGYNNVPIVMMSAGTPYTDSELREAGFSYIINKPFNKEEILELVDDMTKDEAAKDIASVVIK